MTISSFMLWFVALAVIYTALAVGVAIWVSRRDRRGREPFASEDRILRRPGQSIEERLVEIDKQLEHRLFLLLAVPPLVFAGLGYCLKFVPEQHLLWTLGLVCAACVVSFVMRIGDVREKVKEWRRYSLGLAGERYVAHHLQALCESGYRIYHDIPVAVGDRRFNLDHVIVGPTGVFLVETKTRSKPNAHKQKDDHIVTTDGWHINWPNCREDRSAEQAGNNARWLSREIESDRQQTVTVVPIVAIPGWMVKPTKPRGDGKHVWIGNPKMIPGFVVKEKPSAHFDHRKLWPLFERLAQATPGVPKVA